MNEKTEFSMYLKSIRKEKQKTLVELSNAIDVSQSYLSQLEISTRKPPKANLLFKIADFLGDKEQEKQDIYNNLMQKAGYIDDDVWIGTFSPNVMSAVLDNDKNSLLMEIGDLMFRIHELENDRDLKNVFNGSCTPMLDGDTLSQQELQSLKMIIDGIRANRKEK